MKTVEITQLEGVATVTLARGKVNAVNEVMVAELSEALATLAKDRAVSSVILTGQGKFFSFGFDVPEMYNHAPEVFGKFIVSFCTLYREMFLFPKPIVAAINGHAIAGGCILALACDYRILVREGAKMSLNEVTFGASLFAGVVEMVRWTAGNRNAERILLSGAMFGGQESLTLGLADELSAPLDLMKLAHSKARDMAANIGPAYVSQKNLLKRPLVNAWMLREEQSIREWLQIWYSPETRHRTKEIQIH